MKDVIPVLVNDDVKEHGALVINALGTGDNEILNEAHRDEHYLFIFQKKGSYTLIVDFKEITLKGRAVYFIAPGQVHQHVISDNAIWVIAVDPGQLNEVYQMVLESCGTAQQPVTIPAVKARKFDHAIGLLDDELKNGTANIFKPYIKRGLLEVIVGMFAEEYADAIVPDEKSDARSITITREFKALLFLKYKIMKRPSDYADALNISTPYLNEAVKMNSGFTVSYWIQKMVMMEAKRLLNYTDKTVKKIAFELGYQDYAYFSRLFTKTQKVSPKAYRRRYR
jgi:AraC-like DNA-binding protein